MSEDPLLRPVVAQFLEAIPNDERGHTCALLDAHPDVASFSVHTAATVGNLSALQQFLRAVAANATLSSVPDGIEPIIFAASGHIKDRLQVSDSVRTAIVTALLDAGASANAYVQLPHDTNAKISALYFACVSNNVAAARILLERGADPNDSDSVYHAAEHDHRACLALLLAHKAELSAPHRSAGNTPIYFLACYPERHETIAAVASGMRWLLEHRADPNVPS